MPNVVTRTRKTAYEGTPVEPDASPAWFTLPPLAFVATAATDSAPPPLDEYEKQRGGVDLRAMRWLDGLQVPRVTRAMGTRASNSARTSRFQRWWERRQRARRR